MANDPFDPSKNPANPAPDPEPCAVPPQEPVDDDDKEIPGQ